MFIGEIFSQSMCLQAFHFLVSPLTKKSPAQELRRVPVAAQVKILRRDRGG